MWHIAHIIEKPYATCSKLAQAIRACDSAFKCESPYAWCSNLAQVIRLFDT